MKAPKLDKIEINLANYKIHLFFSDYDEPLILYFNTPSRRFYFSLIGFLVNKMKSKDKIDFIGIQSYEDEIKTLDNYFLAEKSSKKPEEMWEKVRKAWRSDDRLPNLRKGSLFELVGRERIKPGGEKGGSLEYECSDEECDAWSSLIRWDEEGNRPWHYSFAIGSVGLTLDNVNLFFEDNEGVKAWGQFTQSLVTQLQVQESKNVSKIEFKNSTSSSTKSHSQETTATETKDDLDLDYDYFQNLIERLPALPPHEVVGRENDLIKITQILEKVIHSNEKRYKQKLCIIHGLPGVGKTTLSIVLSHDKEVQSLFKDGIIWTFIGKTSNLLSMFKSLAVPLKSRELNDAKNVKEAEFILSKLLKKKKFLIIVDDVWDVSDIKPILSLSKNTPTILTTRLRELAYSLSPNPDEIYKLDILSDTESLKLLKGLVPIIVKEHPTECNELVRTIEGLPLAIKVAGHLLRKQKEYGLSVTKLLDDLKKGREMLDATAPSDIQILTDESTPTVAVLLKRSTDFLKPFTRECFSILAFLPSKPARFDIEKLRKIWKVDNPEIILKELLDFGLIEPSSEEGIFQIHFLMVILARSLLNKEKVYG